MNKVKFYLFAFLALACLAIPVHALTPWGNQKFEHTFYFEQGGKGSRSGLDAGNAKPISSTDLMAIAANSVIEHVYVVIDTQVTGVADISVGDDDSATGYVSNVSLLSAAGVYGYGAKLAGPYLRVTTAGASDVADSYIVPNAKFYSATGKEIKLAVSGTSAAGKFRVVVVGYRL